MRDLIIIPTDGKNSEGYMRTKVDMSKKHLDVLNDYIEKNKVNLEPEASMYMQGVLMAMYGYCVVEISDINFNAFIPRTITKEQYNWFNENLEEIKQYAISAEVMDLEEGIIQIKKDTRHGSNPLARLYSLLEKRVEEEVKTDDIRRSK